MVLLNLDQIRKINAAASDARKKSYDRALADDEIYDKSPADFAAENDAAYVSAFNAELTKIINQNFND